MPNINYRPKDLLYDSDEFNEDYEMGTTNAPKKLDPWAGFDKVSIANKMGVPSGMFDELFKEYRGLNVFPRVDDLERYVAGRVEYTASTSAPVAPPVFPTPSPIASYGPLTQAGRPDMRYSTNRIQQPAMQSPSLPALTPTPFYRSSTAIAPPAIQGVYGKMAQYGITREEVDDILKRKLGTEAVRTATPETMLGAVSEWHSGWMNQVLKDEHGRDVNPISARTRQPGELARVAGAVPNVTDITAADAPRDLLHRGEGVAFTFESLTRVNFAPPGSTPGTTTGTYDVNIPNEAAKAVKLFQRDAPEYPQPDIYRGDVNITKSSNMFGFGDQPLRGHLGNVAFLMSDINPEGYSRNPTDPDLRLVTRTKRSYDVEPGRKFNFAEIGTTWDVDAGEQVIPFEGATPLDVAGGGQVILKDVVHGTRQRTSKDGKEYTVSTVTPILERWQDPQALKAQDKTGVSKTVKGFFSQQQMQEWYDPKSLREQAAITGNETFNEMAAQYEEIEGATGVKASEFSYNYAKYLKNLPGVYWSTRQAEAGKVLGKSEGEMASWKWNDDPEGARKLYSHFMENIIPTVARDVRHQIDVDPANAGIYADITDPELTQDLPTGKQRLTTVPIKTLFLTDLMSMTRADQGTGSSNYIPGDVMSRMRESLPEVAEYFNERGRYTRERAQEIRSAALVNTGKYENVPGTVDMTPEMAESVLTAATGRAMESGAYANPEEIPETVMTGHITRAAAESEFGKQQLRWSSGVTSASPEAIRHMMVGGAVEGEEFSKLASGQARMIKALANNDEKKLATASAGFKEEQETISASKTIERAFSGTYAKGVARYGVAGAAEDIAPNMAVIPDEMMLSALGVRSKKGKKYDAALAATVPILIDRAPSLRGGQYEKNSFMMAISQTAYKAGGGAVENQSSILLSSVGLEAAGGADVDGDFVQGLIAANMVGYNKDTGNYDVNFGEGMRYATSEEIEQRGEMLATESFRGTNKRELEGDRLESVRLDRLREYGPQELNLASRINASMKRTMGADYNVLKLLEAAAIPSGQRDKAFSAFSAVYGIEQTPKTLSEHGRRLMDIMGSSTALRRGDRTAGGAGQWQKFGGGQEGLGGAFGQAFRSAIQAPEISLAAVGLFVPQAQQEQVRGMVESMRPMPVDTPSQRSAREKAISNIVETVRDEKRWQDIAMQTPAGVTLGGIMMSRERGKKRAKQTMGVNSEQFALLEQVADLYGIVKKEEDPETGKRNPSDVQQAHIERAREIAGATGITATRAESQMEPMIPTGYIDPTVGRAVDAMNFGAEIPIGNAVEVQPSSPTPTLVQPENIPSTPATDPKYVSTSGVGASGVVAQRPDLEKTKKMATITAGSKDETPEMWEEFGTTAAANVPAVPMPEEPPIPASAGGGGGGPRKPRVTIASAAAQPEDLNARRNELRNKYERFREGGVLSGERTERSYTGNTKTVPTKATILPSMEPLKRALGEAGYDEEMNVVDEGRLASMTEAVGMVNAGIKPTSRSQRGQFAQLSKLVTNLNSTFSAVEQAEQAESQFGVEYKGIVSELRAAGRDAEADTVEAEYKGLRGTGLEAVKREKQYSTAAFISGEIGLPKEFGGMAKFSQKLKTTRDILSTMPTQASETAQRKEVAGQRFAMTMRQMAAGNIAFGSEEEARQYSIEAGLENSQAEVLRRATSGEKLTNEQKMTVGRADEGLTGYAESLGKSADIESDFQKVTVQLTEARKNLAKMTLGSVEREEMQQKITQRAASQGAALLGQAYEEGGIGGQAEAMTTPGYRGFAEAVRKPEGRISGMAVLRGVKSLIAPFSPTGAMIRAVWKMGVGEAGEDADWASQIETRQLLSGAATGGEGQLGAASPMSDVARRNAQRVSNRLAAANTFEQAWGWTKPSGDAGVMRALGGPAIAAGAATGIGINALSAIPGLAAIAPFALPVGLAVAGIAAIAGGTSYAVNASEQTPYNYARVAKEQDTLEAGKDSSIWAKASAQMSQGYRFWGATLRGENQNDYAKIAEGYLESDFDSLNYAERDAAKDLIAGRMRDRNDTMNLFNVPDIKSAMDTMHAATGVTPNQQNNIAGNFRVLQASMLGKVDWDQARQTSIATGGGVAGTFDVANAFKDLSKFENAQATRAANLLAPAAQLGLGQQDVINIARDQGGLVEQIAWDWSVKQAQFGEATRTYGLEEQRRQAGLQYGANFVGAPISGEEFTAGVRPDKITSLDQIGGWYQEERQLKKQQRELGFARTEGGSGYIGQFAFQQRGMDIQASQFGENFALAGRQQDEQRGWQLTTRAWEAQDFTTNVNRSLVGRGWRDEDMNTGFQRSNQRLDWQSEDMSSSWRSMQSNKDYQKWQLDFQQRQSGMQRQWQTEDFATARSVGQMQFGWSMEDSDESLRYATGRQRRQLLKQRSRATIMQGVEEGKISTQEERAGETWKMEDESFAKRKERLEEESSFQEEAWNKQKSRLEQQRTWLTEDFTRDTGRNAQRDSWQDDDWTKEEARREVRIKHEENLYEMQQEARDLQKKHFDEQQAEAAVRLEEEIKYYEESKVRSEELRVLAEKVETERLNSLAAQLVIAETISNTTAASTAMGYMATRLKEAGDSGAIAAMRALVEQVQAVRLWR